MENLTGMAQPPLTKPIQYRLEAILAYGMFGLFRLLPIDWVSAIGGTLASLFGPLSRAHRTARRNLTRALPGLPEQNYSSILGEVWNNFGRVMAEYAVLSRLGTDKEKNRVEAHGLEHIAALSKSGRPTIMFASHIANWEVAALTVGWNAAPPALVYRAPNNPLIEDLLQRARGHATSALIPKGSGGARTIVSILKNGGFVQMAVDQKMNTGIAIPFFGRNAMTGDAIARLALRYDCAILPARCERLDGCRFKVTYEEPWYPEVTGDQDADIRTTLERINQTIEGWVREKPGQWLWLHNRWPRDEKET